MMTNSIGIAVVGCGYWGVNYVRVFNELTDTDVVAICDQRTARLAEIGQRFPGAHQTDSLDYMLQLEDVDAVVVCTGATTHFEVASRCIAAGKHVLIEKPLTTRVEDAERLTTMADEAGVTLMVGHTFLYNPAVELLKEYLGRSDMGEIYYLYSSRTNLGPIRQDVNALWDLAPHDISIFNYLLDSTPLWVSAVGAKVLKNRREDVGFVSLGYPNNVVGNLHVSWADPNKVRQLVLVGSNRRIVFDDLNPLERVKIFEKGVSRVEPEAASYGEFQYRMRDGDISSPRVEASEPLKNQCQHFIKCIATAQRPRTDGRAGLEVVQVMTAIDRSIAQNGAPVSVEQIALSNPVMYPSQERVYAF
ncbi:MAG: Gfo/Idh/MocA family oxidoreductase [Caldilineaceae bacterium]|nr:Gfo/Idh/MocA family oxidoreductase [Caldilineaceae bacterium]